MSSSYYGLNIQWPISEMIISGKKSIETRTYPVPTKYLNKKIVLVETPGKKGKFKSRVRAIIIIKSCFKYKNKKEFYSDVERHCVLKGSEWDWKDKPKWAWELEVVKLIDPPFECKKKGIVYRSGIHLN